MYTFENAEVINSPLKGIYFAGNSPIHFETSHKTDFLAQTYAIDILNIRKNTCVTPWKKMMPLYLWGMKSESFVCWKKDITSPFDGTVVDLQDGETDYLWNHALISPLLKNKFKYEKKANSIFVRKMLHKDIKEYSLDNEEDKYKLLNIIAGNYVIIKKHDNDIFAYLSHLCMNSISVKKGQHIKSGEKIAKLGNSGNSTVPHLHFHLSDSSDLWNAKGIPFVFSKFQEYKNYKWVENIKSLPETETVVKFF